MHPNGNRRVIGSCSQCSGTVSVPTIWHGTNRPVASCESCGAVAMETSGMPVIPTKPNKDPWGTPNESPKIYQNEDTGNTTKRFLAEADYPPPTRLRTSSEEINC